MPAAPARGIGAVTVVALVRRLGDVAPAREIAAGAALAALARVDGLTDSNVIAAGGRECTGNRGCLGSLGAIAVLLNCMLYLSPRRIRSRRIRGLRLALARCAAATLLELRHERAHRAEVDLHKRLRFVCRYSCCHPTP
jgi:hypothetical protein